MKKWFFDLLVTVGLAWLARLLGDTRLDQIDKETQRVRDKMAENDDRPADPRGALERLQSRRRAEDGSREDPGSSG